MQNLIIFLTNIPKHYIALVSIKPFLMQVLVWTAISIFQIESVKNKKTLTNIRDKSSGWSGRQDLNLRPSAPKADAIPSYATPRLVQCVYNNITGTLIP